MAAATGEFEISASISGGADARSRPRRAQQGSAMDRRDHHQRHNRQPRAPGLMGFGMTTVLLNLHNAGIIHCPQILAMGLCYGVSPRSLPV